MSPLRQHHETTDQVVVQVEGHLDSQTAQTLAETPIPSEYLRTLAMHISARRSLAPAMESAKVAASPQLARSLQARENWLRGLEHEFGTLSRQEVATLRGARSTNRSMAGEMREKGQILGYRRGNADRFPAFQFGDGGQVRPAMPKLISLARENGWEDLDVLVWLTNPSTYFADQARPVDHLDEIETVLAAAADAFEAR